jgi:hypothetical protein
MKNLITVLILFSSFQLYSQSNNDQSRIILNSFVFDKDNKLPQEAKTNLQTKLGQIASDNGIGGDSFNPRFILAAKINTQTKDIIAGPPQMIALNLDVVFYIGDAIDNQIYSNTSISIKGVGTNENKALINAFQQISTKNKNFTDLINVGKAKIVNYYTEKCDFITQRSKTLSQQQKYDEAIYELMQVPEVCKTCFENCMTSVQPIFQSKIDRESTLALNQSKTIWNSSPNSEGAREVAKLLSSIDPSSAVYKDALAFSEVVRKKNEADEKRGWDFKMQKYADGVKLEQQRMDAISQVAVAYYQNQPRTIIYNRLIW